MGVCGIKVLESSSLREGIKNTEDSLEKLEEQIADLQEQVKSVTALDDSFRGKGAEAIQSFYQELHLPFLLFLEGAVADYQDVLVSMKKSLQSLESAENGYIKEEFLLGETEDGLQEAKQTTMRLTDEANAVIDSVGGYCFAATS